MKKNHILYALTALTLSLSIISCSTTGASAQANVASSEETASGEGTSLGGKTAYATHLGNFDPIKLPEVMSLHMSFKKLAARDLSRNYLVPRTNKVEIYFRDNINAFCLILPEAARHAIIDAANKFVADQEAGTIEDTKPTDKNAYAITTCDLWWGAGSPVYGAENTKLCINSKFVDDKAYLVLRLPSAKGTSDKRVYSPYTELYFSPAQAMSLCEILDQENLKGLVKQMEEKALAY